jgi:hypothetical protein
MLNLEPPDLHRLRVDLVMHYKILHGLMSVDVSSHFTYYYPPISSSSGSLKLVKPDIGNNNFTHSFLTRLLTAAWNNTPHTWRFCDSLSKLNGA